VEIYVLPNKNERLDSMYVLNILETTFELNRVNTHIYGVCIYIYIYINVNIFFRLK
jgi:hypothetical protein